MKTCNKCNTAKELNEFYKDKRNRDGLYTYCKPCHMGLAQARHKERYHTDPAYRALDILRSRLYQALKGMRKSASTIELLGCTAEHARFHIESQFTEGMTWENTHIDHIQPCASFDLEDPNEQRKCFHYTNLQPLLAEDNLRKSDSIVEEHQVRLL